MSLEAAPDQDPKRPPLRVVRDAHRPSVTSAEAARRIGRSRFWVTEQIQNGGIDGYGVKGPHRTRWYAYEDALPAVTVGQARSSGTTLSISSDVDALVRQLLDGVSEERRRRVDAFGLLHGALDEMARAAAVAREEKSSDDSVDHDIEAQQIAAKSREADLQAQRLADYVNHLLYELGTRLARSIQERTRDEAG